MKSLIKLAVLLIIGILVYNYFFGNEQEQKQSQAIFNEARDLGEAAWNLLKSEKEKFDQGKYDGALDKIGNLIDSLKDKATALKDSELINKVLELESKKQELEQQMTDESMQSYDQTEAGEKSDSNQIRKNWDALIRETEALMKKLETEKEN